MKKLTLKPEDLCVESFGTLALPRARGTVRGAADTLAKTCTCTESIDKVCADSIDVCPDTWLCGDTNNPSCPHTCGIVIANGAAGDGVMAPQSWNCPCM